MEKRFEIILFWLMILVIMPFAYSLTGSMGNAMMILEKDVPLGSVVTIDRTIRVNNDNDIPIIVSLEPEAKSSFFLRVIDSEVTLQPGETANARFQIILKSGGNYSGKILVSFNPADPESRDAPIGLASNIIVHATGPVNQFYYDFLNYTGNVSDEFDGYDDLTDIDDAGFGDSNGTNKTVSVSLGKKNTSSSSSLASTSQDTGINRPALWVGIALLAVIIILVLLIVLIIFKLKED